MLFKTFFPTILKTLTIVQKRKACEPVRKEPEPSTQVMREIQLEFQHFQRARTSTPDDQEPDNVDEPHHVNIHSSTANMNETVSNISLETFFCTFLSVGEISPNYVKNVFLYINQTLTLNWLNILLKL